MTIDAESPLRADLRARFEPSTTEVHETWKMNKKQVIAVSTVAAIPAMGLLVFLVLGLLQGMLADGARVSIVLWIVWALAALSSILVAFLPFAIMFFPGLMPESAAASITDSSAGPGTAAPGRDRVADDDIADDADEDEFEDSAETADDGEQLFEDDALDQEYDDEFGDSFDDDKK